MIAALLALCLAAPLDSLDPPPLLDERAPVVVDPAGDPPPLPADPATEPVPLLPVAPAPPATTTTTPAPDARGVPVPLPHLEGFAVPGVMAGALVGAGGMAATGLFFVAAAHGLVGVGDPSGTAELLGWALLASAPALGGLLAGAVALLFLDGAGMNDWGSLVVCTTLAWVGSLAIVALVAIGFAGGGGGGSGCNPNGCGNMSGCGNCGSGGDDMFKGAANVVAAGAVFGAFAGGAVGAFVAVASGGFNGADSSLYLAAGATAGAAIGAPIGAAIPAFGLD